MKRYLIVLGVLLFALILQACSTSEATPPTNEQSTLSTVNTISEPTKPWTPNWEIRFYMTDGFAKLIEQTPIDVAQPRAVATDHSALERFADHWEKELEHVFEKLLVLLSEKDRKALMEEQQLWEDYLNAALSFRKSIINEKNSDLEEYIFEYQEESTLNSIRLYETRKRTLELMEYYYRFTGEVEFVFGGIDEEF